MRNKILWLSIAAISSAIGGAVLPIIFPAISQCQAIIIAIIAFAIMVIAIYKADLLDRKHQKTEQIEHDNEVKNNAKKYIKDSSVDVSLRDKLHIIGLNYDMLVIHGKHGDINGMLVDKAEGVPLSELLNKRCRICNDGTLRNQRIKRRGKNEL